MKERLTVGHEKVVRVLLNRKILKAQGRSFDVVNKVINEEAEINDEFIKEIEDVNPERMMKIWSRCEKGQTLVESLLSVHVLRTNDMNDVPEGKKNEYLSFQIQISGNASLSLVINELLKCGFFGNGCESNHFYE